MREAPSLVLIDQLVKAGANVRVYDPVAMDETKRKIGDIITYASDQYDALLDADALALVTEWQEFRVPNFKVMERLVKNKVVFDGRNIYDPMEMKEFGYEYFGIGRSAE